MFLLTFHYNFVYHWYTRSHMTPDIVYVPIEWSLRFYAAQYIKSHTTPDMVYVPTKWSLRFYVPTVRKISYDS